MYQKLFKNFKNVKNLGAKAWEHAIAVDFLILLDSFRYQ
jgi:hypothetical protein